MATALRNENKRLSRIEVGKNCVLHSRDYRQCHFVQAGGPTFERAPGKKNTGGKTAGATRPP
jgi:hypothetical protein